MSDQLHLEIVTPEKTILNEFVDSVTLPGIEGEMGILTEHIPLLTIVDSGILTYTVNEIIHSIAVHWGYAQVEGNSVRILAEIAESPSEIDLERAKEAEKKARNKIIPNGKIADLEGEENRQIKYERKLKRSVVRQRLAKTV